MTAVYEAGDMVTDAADDRCCRFMVVRRLHLVVGGHEVVVAALDGHIAVRPARVLAPLPHIACSHED